MITSLKKTFSVLLSAAILFAGASGVFAEDSTEDVYRKIAEDTKYQKAAAVLNGLGYIELTEDPSIIEGPVMREDYTLMAAKVLGIAANDGFGKAETIYEDVDEYSAAAAAIAAMTAGGYVSGYEKEFRPYDDILYEEALCIAVHVLGYGRVAGQMGAYPDWYVAQAGKLKLTSGVDGKVGEPLTYRAAVKLMYNVINTGMLDIEKIYSDGTADYRVTDTTLLEGMHHIYKATGIVTANYLTGLLSPNVDISDNMLEIDHVKYEVSESSMLYGERAYLASMLGYSVEYYYYDDEGDDTGLLFAYVLDKNKELVIKSEDITQAALSKISYTNQQGADKTISFGKDTYFIYNGKADAAAEDGDLMPECGSLRLIDNDNDGKYEVVFIVSYTDYFVSSINYDDKTIYDNASQQGQSRALNLGDSDFDIVVYVDGEEDTFDGIMKNGVISVCRSKDGDLYTIYIGIDEVDGTVEGTGADEDGAYLVIDGERYWLSPSYKNTVQLGLRGTFYFDYAGKIAGIKTADNGGRRFGILWRVYEDDTLRTDGELVTVLELYTSDSTWEKYPCKEKLLVDGERRKNEGLYDYLSSFTRDIIGYELDENNELKLIDTPVQVSDNSVQPFRNKDDNLMERYLTGYRTYKGAYKSFVKYTGDDSMFLSPNAVIFGMGTDIKSDMVKERIMTMTSSNFWSDADFKVRGFSTDSELVDVVVYTEQRTARTSNSPLCLVTSAAAFCTEEGDIKYRLEGLRDGKEFSILIEEGSNAEEVAKTLVTGDCVVLLANLDGEVYDLIKLFDYNAKRVAGNLDSGLNTSRGLYGTIGRYEYNILWVDTAAQTQYYAVVGTKVYIFHENSGIAEIGKIDDIQQGQKALVRIADELVKEIVIFK